MSAKDYTYELRIIQVFIFPPWGLYKLATSGKVKKRRKAGIFFLVWGTLQWLLFITTGSNIIMNFIWSNIAICLFFISNLYIALDMNEFSDEEKKRLHSMPLKMLVTFTCFFIMYSAFFYSTSRVNYSPLTANTITWSSLHIIMNVTLVFSWVAFMFIDKYEVFELFPKTEFKEGLNRLMPLTSGKITNIYFMYLFIIVLVGTAIY